MLGEHPSTAGRVWHLPNDPSPATTGELVDLARSAAGTGPGRVRATPWPLLRLAGLRNPTARELLEMRYEFDEPFLVDSSRIARELGVTATPYADAIAATLAGYRAGAARGAPPHARDHRTRAVARPGADHVHHHHRDPRPRGAPRPSPRPHRGRRRDRHRRAVHRRVHPARRHVRLPGRARREPGGDPHPLRGRGHRHPRALVRHAGGVAGVRPARGAPRAQHRRPPAPPVRPRRDHGRGGGAAGTVQVVGFARWTFAVPYLAGSYVDPASGPATRDATVVAFEVLHRFVGGALGEHLGFALTAVRRIATAVLLARLPRRPRLLAPTGVVAGLAIATGSSRRPGRPGPACPSPPATSCSPRGWCGSGSCWCCTGCDRRVRRARPGAVGAGRAVAAGAAARAGARSTAPARQLVRRVLPAVHRSVILTTSRPL